MPIFGKRSGGAGEMIRLMPEPKSLFMPRSQNTVHYKTFKKELLTLRRRSPNDFKRLMEDFESVDPRDRKFYVQAAAYRLHHMHMKEKSGIMGAHYEAIAEANSGRSFLSPYVPEFQQAHDIIFFDSTCPKTPKRMMLALQHRQAIRTTAYVDGDTATIYVKGFSKWDSGPYGNEVAYCPSTGKFHNIALAYGKVEAVGPSKFVGNAKLDELIIYLEERELKTDGMPDPNMK